MKFTAAFVAAAHAAAKANTASLSYRQRLSIAMKAAYAAAKQPQVLEMNRLYASAQQPATYKQFSYLLSLAGVTTSRGLANFSQFSKKVNSWDASALIDAALSGQPVHLLY